MEIIPFLKQLAETEGVTGFEDPVSHLLEQAWRPFSDEIKCGKLGSLIALKTGQTPAPRPRLMLAAHMDEIGLRVAGVEDGFLRVSRVGGVDRRVLLGLEVTVHATRASRDRRNLAGVVATRPPHVLTEKDRKKTVPWDQVFVDVGLPPKEVERLVSVGDLISFRREIVELKNGRVAGKALDNRSCVVILTLVLEHLSRMCHDWDVLAVATVQEEIGVKGAVTSAYGLAPDLAVVLDVTFAAHPGVPAVDSAPLGMGPVISLGPNLHPGVVARLKAVAEAHEIPYQCEAVPTRLGTDARAIQVSREGVPTGQLCLPLRYMHQPVETLDVCDMERAARLLSTFIAELEVDFLAKLAADYAAVEER